jgi:peptide/nickel transport system permease protein
MTSRYIARKLLHILVVLLLVSFFTAFMLDLTPGDPAYAILGDQATPEQVAQVHKDLELDRPFYQRYIQWLGVGHIIDSKDYTTGILQGDFGTSYRTKEKVMDVIKERLPVTLELVVLAVLLALAIAIPIGIFTAYRADGKFDRSWRAASSALISLPPFVSSLILVFIFALTLRHTFFHFPVTGWTRLTDNLPNNLWSAALPVFTLALIEIPAYSILLRADMIATLQEDYILAARAKGLPTMRILLRHALRPSSFSLLTLAALSLGRLIGGSIIVETVFALPGLGQLLVTSITQKDVLIVQGVVMFVAIAYVLLNAFVDVMYHVLDPRVRTTKAAA